MDKTTLRRWATPMTIGAFILMTVTGIMMFFHIEAGLIKVAHEWLSWAMVIAVALHVFLNWTSFSRYFSQKAGIAVISLFALITVASMFISGDERHGPPGREGMMAATQLLTTAPLDKLAALSGSSVEALQAKLQEQGLTIDDTMGTLDEIAQQNQRSPVELLGQIASLPK